MNRSKNPMLTFIRENLLVEVVVASALWTGCVAGKIRRQNRVRAEDSLMRLVSP